MKYQMQMIALVSALTLVVGAFAYGFYRGSINELAKIQEDRNRSQQELFDLADELSERAAEVLRLQREREGLINDLEQQALQAEGSSAPGVAATGGLQRLEQRWDPSD